MLVHILHKKDKLSQFVTYILCREGNVRSYFVTTAADWTYKHMDGTWADNRTPTCEACLLLALANPDSVLQTDL